MVIVKQLTSTVNGIDDAVTSEKFLYCF